MVYLLPSIIALGLSVCIFRIHGMRNKILLDIIQVTISVGIYGMYREEKIFLYFTLPLLITQVLIDVYLKKKNICTNNFEEYVTQTANESECTEKEIVEILKFKLNTKLTFLLGVLVMINLKIGKVKVFNFCLQFKEKRHLDINCINTLKILYCIVLLEAIIYIVFLKGKLRKEHNKLIKGMTVRK